MKYVLVHDGMFIRLFACKYLSRLYSYTVTDYPSRPTGHMCRQMYRCIVMHTYAYMGPSNIISKKGYADDRLSNFWMYIIAPNTWGTHTDQNSDPPPPGHEELVYYLKSMELLGGLARGRGSHSLITKPFVAGAVLG